METDHLSCRSQKKKKMKRTRAASEVGKNVLRGNYMYNYLLRHDGLARRSMSEGNLIDSANPASDVWNLLAKKVVSVKFGAGIL